MFPFLSSKQESFGTSRFFALLVPFALTLTFTVTISRHTAAQSEPDSTDKLEKQIQEKWIARYAKLNSVEFHIDVSETFEKGYLSSMPVGPLFLRNNQENKSDAPLLPEQDSLQQSKLHIVADGDKLYLESNGPKWHAAQGLFKNYHVNTAFDGNQTRRLQETDKTNYRMQGYIGDGKNIGLLHTSYTSPLSAWLGPLWTGDRQLIDPKSLEIQNGTGSDELIEVYEHRSRLNLWLDPTRDFVPVRLLKKVNSKQWQIDVNSYERQDQIWIPTHWTYVSTTVKTHFIDCGIHDVTVNPQVPPETFKIEFPPGSAIRDQTGGKNETYELSATGTKLPLKSSRTKPGAP